MGFNHVPLFFNILRFKNLNVSHFALFLYLCKINALICCQIVKIFCAIVCFLKCVNKNRIKIS